jgi:hypothetical protein
MSLLAVPTTAIGKVSKIKKEQAFEDTNVTLSYPDDVVDMYTVICFLSIIR